MWVIWKYLNKNVKCFWQQLGTWHSLSLFHTVSWCFTLFNTVSWCFTLFHSVSWRFTLFLNVSQCFSCRSESSNIIDTHLSLVEVNPAILTWSVWQCFLDENQLYDHFCHRHRWGCPKIKIIATPRHGNKSC